MPSVEVNAPGRSSCPSVASLSCRTYGVAEREEHADRHVHEEHPPPGQALGEQPAEDQADRGAGAGDRGVDAERAVALRALGERGRDQRQRGR